MKSLKACQTFAAFSQDINHICQPLKKIGIDYLSYTRVYNNGARIFLSSNQKILEDHFNSKHYLQVWNEAHPTRYQSDTIVVWKTLPNQTIYQKAKAIADISHGIYLFGDNKANYCESYGFATTFYDETIINNYLNNLERLNNFKSYFNDQAKTILRKLESFNFIMPFSDATISKYSPTLESHFVSNSDSINLTPRQKDCGYLLLKGMTAKSIAKELNLSVRTIEIYLQELKKKLNCKNKTELILTLNNYRY